METKQANLKATPPVGNGIEPRLGKAEPPHERKAVLCKTPVPPPSHLLRGAAAEVLAEKFLIKRGLRIMARNFRVKGGEIDLICADGNTTVFVEVRLREGSGFGGAAASITAHKQRRLILAARHWLVKHGECACRFDCVLLGGLDPAKIEWLRGAFSAD
jgi:putative endonuclease